ncbi:glycoside hydrolase family 3 protein [Bifidobacterium choloepi]|nr:glycoside hydrolase family 3 protein [Bifidobacterium choloepi]
MTAQHPGSGNAGHHDSHDEDARKARHPGSGTAVRHATDRPRSPLRTALFVATTVVVAVALVVGVWFFGGRTWLRAQAAKVRDSAAELSQDIERQTSPDKDDKNGKEATASPTTAAGLAEQAVDGMTVEEQCAQLVMMPLSYGEDPSAVEGYVKDSKVGSVLLMGNWTSGTAGVKQATAALQSYATGSGQIPLFIAVDQEGGQVQHLKGAGFSTIPSAYEQGQMSVGELREYAQQWGGQLATAGVNIDLAPSVDTVVIDRASNAPIGALDRDFGLDADGNAEHAVAFIQGMAAASVGTAVKHFPGLGAVTGNTDFTSGDATVDTVTSVDSIQMDAFKKAIQDGDPDMVMMSLATYTNLDPDHPACFSSYIIQDILRKQIGYDGVVISDSLSASAVSGYDSSQLGVLFVQAGGDLICINDRSLTEDILDGMVEEASQSTDFAAQVKAAATRVLTLKYQMNLDQKNQ